MPLHFWGTTTTKFNCRDIVPEMRRVGIAVREEGRHVSVAARASSL